MGSNRQLQDSDIWSLDRDNSTAEATKDLIAAYEKYRGSILRAILVLSGRSLALSAVAALITAISSLVAPIVLHQIVAALSSPQVGTQTYLLVWLGLLFASKIVCSFVNVHVGLYADMISGRLYNALRAQLFQKTLRRRRSTTSSEDEQQSSCAEVELANLYSSDVGSILSGASKINNLWILPLQVSAVIFLLYNTLGLASFTGLGVILLSAAASAKITLLVGSAYGEVMVRRDERMKWIKFVFNGIQSVKLHGLEEQFASHVGDRRSKELQAVKRFTYTASSTVFILWVTPVLVPLVSLFFYSQVLGGELNAARVFTSIALFDTIRELLQQLPATFQTIIRAKVSLDRISEYLSSEEIMRESDKHIPLQPAAGIAIAVRDASFGWTQSKPVLCNINLEVKIGDLVVVHGAVGSGKSALCLSLLGEMSKITGTATVRGSVAFCSQQPWIQHRTLRDNVLFGLPFDSGRYQAVLRACELLDDLKQLPDGDQTEITQSGANLSQGQKARICLARACYSSADIYILDSPLAAVDAVTRMRVFDNCICGLLAAKTVVMTTHHPEFVSSKAVDYAVHATDGEVKTIRVGSIQPGRLQHSILGRIGNGPSFTAPPKPISTAIEDEQRFTGRVSFTVLRGYFQAIGGAKAFLFVILVQFACQGAQISGDLWLSHYTSQPMPQNSGMAIYALLGVTASIMVLLRLISIIYVGLQASRNLFNAMTSALLHAPARFFDENPIGRILNRYGDDIASVDMSLPLLFGNFLAYALSSIFQLGTAIYIVNTLGLAVIPLLYLYVRTANFYLATSREVVRQFRAVESPLLSHVIQSEEGVVVLRAFDYRFTRDAIAENFELNDSVMRVWLFKIASDHWFALRIQLLGCGVILLVASSLLYLRSFLTPGLVGLLFTYVISIDRSLAGLVQMWSRLELQLVSVERLSEYASILSEDSSAQQTYEKIPVQWPSQGAIMFSKVNFRYGDSSSALVLKDASFKIKPREKIGIVGRTGAGKSSLVMAMFRMNTLASGSIVIDGIDISRIPVQTLRTRMTVVPQEPILFRGSIRNYLDPFCETSDASIWASLERVGLKGLLSGSLGLELTDFAVNWSIGELQLLCLARALIAPRSIVVLDEATASIDHGLEKRIRQTLSSGFSNSTVITIAHKLDSVHDMDRILVLEDGKIIEFDSPNTVAYRLGGVFQQLVREDTARDAL